MFEMPTLLPPSASALMRSLETVMAEPKQGLEVPIAQLWNVDTCPAELLPWLAWSFSVEVWDTAWPESVKRDVIRSAIAVHRIKGTRGSVEAVLAAQGHDAEVSEWFEYQGTPHTFRVAVEITGDTAFDHTHRPAIARAVDTVKPVRSHYDMSFRVRVDEQTHTGAHARIGGMVRTLRFAPGDQTVTAPVGPGAVARRVGIHHTTGLEAA